MLRLRCRLRRRCPCRRSHHPLHPHARHGLLIPRRPRSCACVCLLPPGSPSQPPMRTRRTPTSRWGSTCAANLLPAPTLRGGSHLPVPSAGRQWSPTSWSRRGSSAAAWAAVCPPTLTSRSHSRTTMRLPSLAGTLCSGRRLWRPQPLAWYSFGCGGQG